MSKTLEFYFDFASPNCYLAYRALSDFLGDDMGVDIRPCLLGGVFKATGNQPPMMAYANVRGKMAYEMLEMQRFIACHGLGQFRMNPHFPINTLALMRGLLALDERRDAYIETVLSAMWEAELNMGDAQIAGAVLTEAGFDAAAIAARAEAPAVKEALKDATAAAVARGVFGLPTFFVGDDMFFGKERLGQVAEALGA